MKDKLLKYQLWDMIRLTSNTFETAFRPILEVHGLTTMQSRVLIAINESDNPTVGNISKIIDVSNSNASNMCKKLEQERFIHRIRSEKDERVVILELTNKGKEVFAQINSDIQKIYGPIIEKVPDDKFNDIIKGIKLLNDLLRELENASANFQ